MVVSAKDIYIPLGYTTSWFSSVFGHKAKDYLIDNNAQYDINDIAEVCKAYISYTRNPNNKTKSEAMVSNVLAYITDQWLG